MTPKTQAGTNPVTPWGPARLPRAAKSLSPFTLPSCRRSERQFGNHRLPPLADVFRRNANLAAVFARLRRSLRHDDVRGLVFSRRQIRRGRGLRRVQPSGRPGSLRLDFGLCHLSKIRRGGRLRGAIDHGGNRRPGELPPRSIGSHFGV